MASAATHGARLFDFRHGSADNRRLCDLCLSRRPCVNIAGFRAALGAPVRLWYALLSTITPPVCGGVFIAAGMVGENWLKVAFKAMALGIGLYIIPLAMVANPEIIRLAFNPAGALFDALKVAIGLGAISYGVIAHKALWQRGALVAAGTLLIFMI